MKTLEKTPKAPAASKATIEIDAETLRKLREILSAIGTRKTAGQLINEWVKSTVEGERNDGYIRDCVFPTGKWRKSTRCHEIQAEINRILEDGRADDIRAAKFADCKKDAQQIGASCHDIQFQPTPNEFDALNRAANRAGKLFTDWVKETLDAAAAEVSGEVESASAAKAARRILFEHAQEPDRGGNLFPIKPGPNQLAAYCRAAARAGKSLTDWVSGTLAAATIVRPG